MSLSSSALLPGKERVHVFPDPDSQCSVSYTHLAGSKCVARSSKQTAFGRCDGACVAGDLIVNGLFLDIEFPVDHVWV